MLAANEFGGTKNQVDGQIQQRVASVPASSPEGTIPFEHRLFTKRQMAEYFGITERTVEVWMRHRYLPYVKIGQSVRFRIAMVLRYVDDKYLVPAGEPRRRRKIRGKPVTCAGDHASPDGSIASCSLL